MLNKLSMDTMSSKKYLRALIVSCFFALGALSLSAVVYAQTYTVNFKDADVQELIKFVADSTGKTIVVDPKVKGKIRVVSSKELTETELYDLFLSVLDINGFTAVDAGGIIRVVPSREARTQPVPVNSNQASNDNFTGYLTQVIQVRNVEASKLIPVLRPLVPPQAHLAAYSDSNVIVITDSASNIRRIRQVIERLDNASSEDTEVIRLHNASADEAVKTLENLQSAQLTGGKATRSSGSSLQNQAQLVADLRTNSILVTGPKVARDRIRELAIQIDRKVENLGGARVIRLKHAVAKDLVTVLTKVAESNNVKGSRQSVIQADESTNAVILTGSADVVQTLAGVIAELDVQRSQVLIEAIIVEVSNRGGKDLGINWLFANDNGGIGTSGPNSASNSPDASGLFTGAANAAIGTGSVVAAIASALSGATQATFGVGKIRDSGTSFAALINAFETDGDSNLLSTPSLLTMDNHEAEIVVGQEVPFVTGSYTSTGNTTDVGNPFQTITREDVGITLKVTPHISEGGNITMELLQEVSSIDRSAVAGASDLITNNRKIQTSVSTSDGQIVVLGGLVQDDVRESENKVPLLGDIPVLGRLFRSNSTELEKRHLMVFIRPTIVHNGDKLSEVSETRYDNIRNRQVTERREGVSLYKDSVAPILPAYQSQVGGLDPIEREDPRIFQRAMELEKERIKRQKEQDKYDQQRRASQDSYNRKSSSARVSPAPNYNAAPIISPPTSEPAYPSYTPQSTAPAPSSNRDLNNSGSTRFVPPPGFEPVSANGSGVNSSSTSYPASTGYEDSPQVGTRSSNQAPARNTAPPVRYAPSARSVDPARRPQIEERMITADDVSPIVVPPNAVPDVQRSEQDLNKLYEEIDY